MVKLDRKSSRYLWSALVIATITACVAFVYVSFSSAERKNSSVQNLRDIHSSPEKLTAEKCITVCETEECVQHSKYLFDYIDPDVDPCENFFQFACGKMFEKFNPGEFSSQIERYSDVMTAKLKRLLDKIEADPTSASGKMKIVYESCMKYGSSDLQALPAILKFLSDVGVEDWPNLGPDFKFADRSLSNIITSLLYHQEFAFIEFRTSYEYLMLDDPALELNSTLLDVKSPYEKRGNTTRKYLVDRVLNYFNLDPKIMRRIWEESQAISDGVINLREESLGLSESTENEDLDGVLDCTENTINEWTDICESLKSLIEITGASEKVSENYASIPSSSKYFMKNIFPLLRNFTERSVANYLALNLFINNLDELNFYFRLTNDKVTETLDEADISDLKWKKCARWAAKHMPLAMGYEYLKTYFTEPLLKDVQSLGEECIRESSDLVSRQKWMTDEELRTMKEEVLNIRLNFDDMFEILTNVTEVDKFYEQFHPMEEIFYHNILRYKQFMRTSEMHGLHTLKDSQFAKGLFTPNAGGGGSYIDIYLGLLVPPTYIPHLQRYMNLISLGFVLIHELGHNLETLFGYYIDKSGYYNDKVKCMEEQYSRFTFETIGKNMIASRYHKENFADTIAISVIDKLIEKYSSDNSSSLMPSFSYSLMQQIYISGINMLCTIHTKEMDEMNYKYSSHAPQRFRINGMMQNSKLFSKAFGCAEGSSMNPSTKCLFLE